MDPQIRHSRTIVSRRRALGLGGTIGLGGLLAACTVDGASTPAASDGSPIAPTTSSGTDLVSKLESVAICGLKTEEVTQGPYYFDVDSIRSDIREDRPGATLALAFRVLDGDCNPIPNSVVELWHCDAGGVYSGFEVASTGGGGGGQPGGGSGDVTDGSYSSGVQEATPQDDGTYLRGAQVADANGIAQFTTVYPGWYRGRTVHIHLKVHIDKKNVLTGQVGFDDELSDSLYASTSPYSSHSGRDTYNGGSAGSGRDNIITAADQLLTIEQTADGYLGYINLGLAA